MAPAFEFSGGALCLDFANTVGDRPACANDRLHGLAELLAWSEQGGLLDSAERRRLASQARRRARVAQAAFERAVGLRERLYRIFSAVAAKRPPPPRDLAALNSLLSEALGYLRVAGDPTSGFHWSWSGSLARLDRLLWPVARSAGDLLTSSEAALVRECASDRCSWLFVDRSRTRRRRWCDMKSCGNRAKARRHYRRHKSSG